MQGEEWAARPGKDVEMARGGGVGRRRRCAGATNSWTFLAFKSSRAYRQIVKSCPFVPTFQPV